MASTNINAQEFLDQILGTSKDLVTKSKSSVKKMANNADVKNLTKQGKALATKGENYLIDKFDISDNDKTRANIRKGAAAGALALLLASRSARKVAVLGGMAGLGALAWKAYKKNGGTMPKSAQDLIGAIKGPKAQAQTEARSETLLRAMIAAAKVDGGINDDELDLINAHDDQSVNVLKLALANPESAKKIASLSGSDQEAREIYAVSCRIADGLSTLEREYLDELAMALDLDPELAARLETDIRTGS